MRLVATLLFLVLASPAWGQDRGEIAAWFQSLKLPAPILDLPAGASCCSEADCKQRPVRVSGVIQEAWIEEAQLWAVVPLEARITDQDVLAKHPFFQSIICFIPGRGVVCEATPPAGG